MVLICYPIIDLIILLVNVSFCTRDEHQFSCTYSVHVHLYTCTCTHLHGEYAVRVLLYIVQGAVIPFMQAFQYSKYFSSWHDKRSEAIFIVRCHVYEQLYRRMPRCYFKHVLNYLVLQLGDNVARKLNFSCDIVQCVGKRAQ